MVQVVDSEHFDSSLLYTCMHVMMHICTNCMKSSKVSLGVIHDKKGYTLLLNNFNGVNSC